MPLIHAGFTIPGIVRPHPLPAWEFHEAEITVFGLHGTGVLQGGLVKREFTIPMWIFNGFTQPQLFAFLRSLRGRLGVIGDLVQTGTVSAVWPEVEFLRFTHEEWIPPQADYGWSVFAELQFRELTPA
jgi:hypothetical protein